MALVPRASSSGNDPCGVIIAMASRQMVTARFKEGGVLREHTDGPIGKTSPIKVIVADPVHNSVNLHGSGEPREKASQASSLPLACHVPCLQGGKGHGCCRPTPLTSRLCRCGLPEQGSTVRPCDQPCDRTLPGCAVPFQMVVRHAGNPDEIVVQRPKLLVVLEE